jgi:hypothetical protein
LVSSSSPSDRDRARPIDDARQSGRQIVEYRRPALRIAGGHDEAARLVVAEEPRRLLGRDGLAIDGNDVSVTDGEGRRIQPLAVDEDATLGNPALGIAARAQTRPRHHLGDAFDHAPRFGTPR